MKIEITGESGNILVWVAGPTDPDDWACVGMGATREEAIAAAVRELQEALKKLGTEAPAS